MSTLRRFLKYTPVIAMVMLAIAWIATLFSQFGFGTRGGRFDTHYTFMNRSFVAHRVDGNFLKQGWFWVPKPHPLPDEEEEIAASPHWGYRPIGTGGGWTFQIPILVVITALLPLALGPFVSFRFHLWHYLAFTALVALELAYYLRWQG